MFPSKAVSRGSRHLAGFAAEWGTSVQRRGGLRMFAPRQLRWEGADSRIRARGLPSRAGELAGFDHTSVSRNR